MACIWVTTPMIMEMVQMTSMRYVCHSTNSSDTDLMHQEYDYARSMKKSSFSHYMWLGAIFLATNVCKCDIRFAVQVAILTFDSNYATVIIMLVIAWKSKNKSAETDT
jgi:hypothetical protein